MPIPPLVLEWMPNYYTKPNSNEKSQNKKKDTRSLDDLMREKQFEGTPNQGCATNGPGYKIPGAFLTKSEARVET